MAFDLILDPQRSKDAPALRTLFTFTNERNFYCEEFPDAHDVSEAPIQFVIKLNPARFDDADVAHEDLSDLLAKWFTDGIISYTNRVCRHCRSAQEKQPPQDSRKVEGDRREGSVVVASKPNKDTPPASYLYEHSTLQFPGKPPAHLYSHLEVTAILDSEVRDAFMGNMVFPAVLVVAGVSYRLVCRGFWHAAHYWVKVFRQVVGITGVWLHDDRQNAGLAQLISPDHASIGGKQDYTSWVVYSRDLDESERDLVRSAIDKIKQDNAHASGSLPFTDLLPAEDADDCSEGGEDLCSSLHPSESEHDTGSPAKPVTVPSFIIP